MSEPRSEFLPKPAWRTRVSAPTRWAAVAVTFAGTLVIGATVLVGGLVVLHQFAADEWVAPTVWVILTVIMIVWTLLKPDPATASEDEAQPWSDYVVRAVMIGVDEPRPAVQRIVTGIVFGAPLAVYLVITVVLEALGLF